MKPVINPEYEHATHGVWFMCGTEPLPVELGGDGLTPHDPYGKISVGPPPNKSPIFTRLFSRIGQKRKGWSGKGKEYWEK